MKKLLTVILSCVILTLSFGNVSYATREKEKTTAIVYIGDSRTTGMDKVVGLSKIKDTFVVAKSGMGYNWFMKDGSEALYKIREDNVYDNWIYVFNLGVNDLKNVNNYKNLIRELQKEATVYFVSINPTDDSVGGIQCKNIKEFNSELYKVVGINNYINSYDYLEKVNGFNFDSMEDGMHYDDETYTKLYEFIDMGIKVHEFVKDNNNSYSAYFYLYNFK